VNDEQVAVLLQSLDRDPPAPSTIDIERAVKDGRRRARRRTAAQAASAVVAAALVIAGGAAAVAVRTGGQDTVDPDAAPAQTGPSSTEGASAAASAGPSASAPVQVPAPPAPTRCALSLLPIPDGVRMALVTGADPTGRLIVGRSYPGGGSHQVLLWRDGTVHKVPLDGDDQALNDINTAGTAVGGTFRAKPGGGEEDIRQVPVAYLANGSLLTLAGVVDGTAHAVNEAGTIVGESARRPVRWASPSGTAQQLPLPPGATSGDARDIDEDGTIVGFVEFDGRDERPYVWFTDGTHRELPLPTGAPPAGGQQRQFVRAYGIRNGWVTGIAGMTPAAGAVRWNLRAGEVKVFAEFQSRASMANAHGWQVGTDLQGRAMFLSPAGPVVLPALAAHEPGNLKNIATTVSDDGRTIGGQSDDSNEVIRAVVWRCS
jgi:uncharacterized membrane protein